MRLKANSLIFLFMFIFACASTENTIEKNIPLQKITDSQKKILTLSTYDIARYQSEQDAFWMEAQKQILPIILNRMVLNTPLVIPSQNKLTWPEDMPFFSKEGKLLPITNDITGDLKQEFEIKVTLYPDTSLSGIVTDFKEEHEVAAMYDPINIALFEKYPKKLPAYFFIGQEIKEENVKLIQLIGGGRILKILSQTGPIKLTGLDKKGILCQAQVWASHEEIQKGDYVYLTLVSINAMSKQPPTSVQVEQKATPTETEIVVEPLIEPEPIVEKDSK